MSNFGLFRHVIEHLFQDPNLINGAGAVPLSLAVDNWWEGLKFMVLLLSYGKCFLSLERTIRLIKLIKVLIPNMHQFLMNLCRKKCFLFSKGTPVTSRYITYFALNLSK